MQMVLVAALYKMNARNLYLVKHDFTECLDGLLTNDPRITFFNWSVSESPYVYHSHGLITFGSMTLMTLDPKSTWVPCDVQSYQMGITSINV